MAGAKLCQTNREFAIALQTLVKHLHMTGTVHGFNGEYAIVRMHDKHVVTKFIGMP